MGKIIDACDSLFSPSVPVADIDNNHSAFSHLSLATSSMQCGSQPLTIHRRQQARWAWPLWRKYLEILGESHASPHQQIEAEAEEKKSRVRWKMTLMNIFSCSLFFFLFVLVYIQEIFLIGFEKLSGGCGIVTNFSFLGWTLKALENILWFQ